MDLLLPLVLATVITVVMIPLLERRATALHVLDGPSPRKIHDHPIPRVGGIAMAFGATVPLLLWLPMERAWIATLVGAAVVLVFGVWDDRRDLNPLVKLGGQAVAAAVVILAGHVTIDTFTLYERIEIPRLLAVPLTFVFLLAVTNAINLADGLDGLAGGTTLLTLAVIAALSMGHGDGRVTFFAATVIGSLIGFLRYNSFPARIFMGDGGSQLLGFTTGVLAIILTQDVELPYSSALPLLLLGLPIIDMLTVIVLRVREGRSPFVADRQHLHHRLLDLGFDHFEAVAIVYILQGTLLIVAWFMRFQADAMILLVFGCFAATVMALEFRAQEVGWRWQGIRPGMRLAAIVADGVPWLKAPARLPRWGNVIAWACVSVYVLGVAATSSHVPIDIALLAVLLCAGLILASLHVIPSRAIDVLAHAAAFVAVAVVVYLDHVEPGDVPLFQVVKWVLFPVLAAAIVMRLRFWRERRFEITPLDVLVVIVAIVLPNLPGLEAGSSNVGLSVAKLVVLMYAVEMLLSHSERTRTWLWSYTALGIGVLALRGLLPVAL